MTAGSHFSVVRNHPSQISLQMHIQELFSGTKEGLAPEILQSETLSAAEKGQLNLLT
jgi:hypothetical protein